MKRTRRAIGVTFVAVLMSSSAAYCGSMGHRRPPIPVSCRRQARSIPAMHLRLGAQRRHCRRISNRLRIARALP